MKTGKMILAFAYLRLSREEMQGCESGSIKNQRMIISDYCRQNDINRAGVCGRRMVGRKF